jgi:hypothetical protein
MRVCVDERENIPLLRNLFQRHVMDAQTQVGEVSPSDVDIRSIEPAIESINRLGVTTETAQGLLTQANTLLALRKCWSARQWEALAEIVRGALQQTPRYEQILPELRVAERESLDRCLFAKFVSQLQVDSACNEIGGGVRPFCVWPARRPIASPAVQAPTTSRAWRTVRWASSAQWWLMIACS